MRDAEVEAALAEDDDELERALRRRSWRDYRSGGRGDPISGVVAAVVAGLITLFVVLVAHYGAGMLKAIVWMGGHGPSAPWLLGRGIQTFLVSVLGIWAVVAAALWAYRRFGPEASESSLRGVILALVLGFLVAAVPTNAGPGYANGVAAPPTAVTTAPTTTTAVAPRPGTDPQALIQGQAKASTADAKRADAAADKAERELKAAEVAQGQFMDSLSAQAKKALAAQLRGLRAHAAAARRQAQEAVRLANKARGRAGLPALPQAQPASPPPDHTCKAGQTWNGSKCVATSTGEDWGNH